MQHDSPRTASDYHRQIADALNDSFLRRTLDKFAVEYRVSRDAVFDEIKGRETIKRIADVKDGAAKHLEELYAQFKAEAEKRGFYCKVSRDYSGNDRVAVLRPL